MLSAGDEKLTVFFNSSLASFDIEFVDGDAERLVTENGWQEDIKEYEYEIVGNIYEPNGE